MILKKLKICFLAARVETLVISILPIIIGSLIAAKETSLNIHILILTFLYGILLHAGTNLSNDYYDFKNGVDNENRIAPLSTIQKKLTSLKQIRISFCICFALAFIIGIFFIFRASFIALLFGLPIIFGYFYTGGKKPLGYIGLGEILTLIFFGPFCVFGTYFLQTLKFSLFPIIVGLGPGLLSTSILIINNIRDMSLDGSANKKTLSVICGKKFSQLEYILCILAAFLIPFFCYTYINNRLILTSSLFIFFIPLNTVFKFKNPKILNNGIKQTILAFIVYATLFCIGLLYQINSFNRF